MNSASIIYYDNDFGNTGPGQLGKESLGWYLNDNNLTKPESLSLQFNRNGLQTLLGEVGKISGVLIQKYTIGS